MADVKAELTAIVGAGNVADDPAILEGYASDRSFTASMKPQYTVKPANSDQVQKLVNWANDTGTPLVPVSSGPPHSNGDTIPGVPGAVIVDLSGMNKILNINRRNRMAVIEAGVTYSELQPALAEQGMRLSTSLLPRANKSVIASLLEREPRLNCRLQWSSLDPMRCAEIIWGDGNRMWTGDAAMDAPNLENQWEQQKWQVQPAGPGQTDFYRFASAAQGSMGIATWASLRCEVLPSVHKLFFVPADKLESLTDFTYRLLKYRYADELFVVNGACLAYIAGDSPDKTNALKADLPPWAVIVGIAGRTELPEERVDFQEKDIKEIAGESSLELLPALKGIEGAQLLNTIVSPSRELYWKLDYKGGCQDIFFITTLDRTPEFSSQMNKTAEAAGYPAGDIAVYIQPRHQGVNCHCEFSLPYNPDDKEEASRMQKVYTEGSKAVLERGAFFTRPYGIWSDMAFAKDDTSTRLLKSVKSIFDPNGVMNPGKLCFATQKSEEV